MIGISSACFYPMDTEQTLERLAKTGVRGIELFCNTFSELTPAFAAEMRKRCDSLGLEILSVHPFTSFAEPYLIFSDYGRRGADALDLYKGFFEATRLMGAKLFQFHGDKRQSVMPVAEYAARYARFYEAAQAEGVTFCQENVCRCRSAEIDFLREMSMILGDSVRFTLDLKQAHRSGVDPFDVVAAVGDKIAHLHVNDRTAAEDCLLPGCGDFDFARLVTEMHNLQYTGHWMIEVYAQNYGDEADLQKSYDYLRRIVI